MQNGAYTRPAYPNGPSLGAYSAYVPASPSIYSPAEPPVQDPDLLPLNSRYGLNGTARQTPPSDALLQGYTTQLINGMNYNANRVASPATRATSRLLDTTDPVAMHLLVETALGDSIAYDVLSFDELDRLKKELAMLGPRIESVRKRLALESKVRDAAASLNRLYRQGSSSSPTQTRRRSSQGAASKKDRDSISKTEDELAVANKKCADIARELYSLETRQQKLQTRLLSHTAGVLQMTHRGPSAKRGLNEFPNSPQHGMVNGMNGGRPDSPASIYMYENSRNDIRRGDRDDFDERSLYRPPEDLFGFPSAGSAKSEQAMMKDLSRLGERLEDLNARLKDSIMRANIAQDVSPLEGAGDDGEPSSVASVNRQIDAISGNFDTFAAAQYSVRQQMERLQYQLQQQSRQLEEAVQQKDKEYEDVLEDRNQKLAMAQKRAEQLQLQLNDAEGAQSQLLERMLPKIQYFNKRLYGLLNAAAAAGFKQQETPPPPSYDVADPDAEIEYMESAVDATSKTYQNLLEVAQGEMERGAADRGKADQMESTLAGLWTIILACEEDDRQRRQAMGEQDNNGFNPNEPFSLPAFSTRVQWLVTRAADLHDQAQRSREQYASAREEMLQQLEDEKANSSQAMAAVNSERDERERRLQSELQSSKAGGARIVELEQELEARGAELKQMEQLLEANRATTAERQDALQELRQQLASQEEELSKAKDESGREVERLETELVRLTTDLTIARAELDAAYGSRAERKAEADSDAKKQLDEARAELAALRSAASAGPSARERELEDELKETLREFEELTRASVEAEKERDRLDAVVDQVRQKLDDAEAQLGEERVKWLGVKSPGEAGGGPVETASIATMRAEFKKMMRDQRAEGMKALRAEQDERKKLEAQIRQLRKEKEGPKKSGLSNLLSLG